MNWFTDAIGLTTAEENTPTPTADAQKQSRIQQRTNLLVKITKGQEITNKEIQDFKDSGGKLSETVNMDTKETLLDRAILKGNKTAINELEENGAVRGQADTNRDIMNKVIKNIPNKTIEADKAVDNRSNAQIEADNNRSREQQAKKQQVVPRERADSGYTTGEDSHTSSRANSPATVPNDQKLKVDIPPETWNKSSPDAAMRADQERANKVAGLEDQKNKPIANEATPGAADKADKARADKVARLEEGKNQAIVKPQKTGAEIAAKMEEQLKERKEASQGAATGRINFSTMKKVGKGSGVGGR